MSVMGPFHRTQFALFALFGIVFVATSALCIHTVDRQLTSQAQANVTIISRAIAAASTDILINRDLSTLQATIDQFSLLEDIRYIFIADEHGEMIVHTFVPKIPERLLSSDLQMSGTFERALAPNTVITEIATPILGGFAGTVHVGIEPGLVRLQLQKAVGRQVYLISILYLLSIFAVLYLFRHATRPLGELSLYMAQRLKPSGSETLTTLQTQRLLERDDLTGQLARRTRAIADGADSTVSDR